MFSSIAFVGGGAMATAIIEGILTRRLIEPQGIVVSEPLAERRDALVSQFGVRAAGDNCQAAADSDIAVLAVKPQVIQAVLQELSGNLTAEQLVISIAAGVTISTLREGLRHDAIVRSVPNTPAQIGQGMTVWTATSEVSDDSREDARMILGALGRELYVADEHYLDMATALSGSGPAWVFLFLEAMIDAGVHLGFSRAVAEELVYQTVLGSTMMARQSDRHLAELRNMVTSPGGTTAAGLYHLEYGRLRVVIDRAVQAACERARELGRGR